MLAGTDPSTIVEKVHFMLNKKKHWKNPFGDGKAGAMIVQILKERESADKLFCNDKQSNHKTPQQVLTLLNRPGKN